MEENVSKYTNAVGSGKQAILQSQYRAAKLVTINRQPLAVDLQIAENNTVIDIDSFALQN